MQKTLHSLPKELLFKIRSHIHSLHDHVQFSLTCKATYSLYDDDFWRFACTSSGWSLSAKVVKRLETSLDAAPTPPLRAWAALARMVVADEKTFKNYKDIEWSAKDEAIFERELLEYLSKPPVPEVDPKQKISVIPHGWMDCTFKASLLEMFKLTNYEVDDWVDRDMPYLFKHPFVANRFLTNPIVSEMVLDDGKVGLAQGVINPFGITVADAHLSLASVLQLLAMDMEGDEDDDEYGGQFEMSHPFFEGFTAYGRCLSANWGS